EFEIVAGRAIEAAAAHFEFRLLRQFEIERLQLAVIAALMDLGEVAAHLRRDLEGGAVHAERLEQMVLEILAELLPAHRLDHLAGPVDVDAVFPALAGIEEKRRAEGR